jgi:hypothetical protein
VRVLVVPGGHPFFLWHGVLALHCKHSQARSEITEVHVDYTHDHTRKTRGARARTSMVRKFRQGKRLSICFTTRATMCTSMPRSAV